MANVDFPENVTPLYAPSAPMSTDQARDYVAERVGLSHLILSANGASIVLTRVRGWTRHEGEALADRHDLDQYAWINADGTYGAGVMTGHGTYRPIARRLLAEVG